MSDHEHDRRPTYGSSAGATSGTGTPGKRSLVESRYGVQRKARTPATDAPPTTAEIAARGVDGPGERLPFMDAIQKSAGRDLGAIEAHIGGPAADACAELGATAYATGNKVAFASPPDLHTATHEATHVLQQRAGVQLKDGTGEAGDEHERQADAAGDAIVAGKSIAPHFPAGGALGGGTVGVQMQKDGGKSKAPKGAMPLVVHVFHRGGKVTTWRGVTDLDDLKGHAFYRGEDEGGTWHWNSPLGDEIDLYKDESDRTPTPITSLARRPSVEFISIHIGATDTEIPDVELVAQMSGVTSAKKPKTNRTGPIDPDRAFFDDGGQTSDAQTRDQPGAKDGQDDGVTGATGHRHRTGGGQHITGNADDVASSGADSRAALAGDIQGQRRGLVVDKSGAVVGRKKGPTGGATGNTHDAGRSNGHRDGTSADRTSITHNPNAEKGDGPGGNIPEDGGRVGGMAGGEQGGKDGGAPIGMGIWDVLTMSATMARTAYVADLVLSADVDGAVDKLVRAAGKRLARKMLEKRFLKKAIKAQIKKLADTGMTRIGERLLDVADWDALDDAAKNKLRARWRYELEDELHRRIDRELTERIEQLKEVVGDGKHMAKELVREYDGELKATMRTRAALREIEPPQGSGSFKKLDERFGDDVRLAKEWAAASEFWPDRRAFDGMMVYRRDDLFDPRYIRDGKTNLERMRAGHAPIGTDGLPVEIHHLNQADEGPVVEILGEFHDRHSRTIHINGHDIPSGIDRPGFDSWRSRYWRNRANEIEPKPARARGGKRSTPSDGDETP
jgi:hypothetical protein